jgi:hypothetical protein
LTIVEINPSPRVDIPAVSQPGIGILKRKVVCFFVKAAMFVVEAAHGHEDMQRGAQQLCSVMVQAFAVTVFLKEHVGAAFNRWRHFSWSSCCVKSMRSRRVPQYWSSLSARRREEPRVGNRFIVQQHIHVTTELQDDMVYAHVLLTLRMQPIHKHGIPQEAWRRLLVFSAFGPSFAYLIVPHFTDRGTVFLCLKQ